MVDAAGNAIAQAPQQNLRHRLYNTLHGADRWLMQRCACTGAHRHITADPADGGFDAQFGCCGRPVGPCALLSSLCGCAVHTPLFLLSCCCGLGYLQGIVAPVLHVVLADCGASPPLFLSFSVPPFLSPSLLLVLNTYRIVVRTVAAKGSSAASAGRRQHSSAGARRRYGAASAACRSSASTRGS